MSKDYVYKRRLLQLVKLLRSLPATRFNYAHWVGSDWGGKPDLSCGTTACALGWATTIPSLKRLGLQLRKGSYVGDAAVVVLQTKDGQSDEATAGREVFGLDQAEFRYLFIPDHHWNDDKVLHEKGYDLDNRPGGYASAKEVANHIQKFVNIKYGKSK